MTRVSEKLIANQFVQETPSGTINGTNVVFSLSSTPETTSQVLLFQDGLSLIQGTHYTISGLTITLTTAPVVGQTLTVYYPKL